MSSKKLLLAAMAIAAAALIAGRTYAAPPTPPRMIDRPTSRETGPLLSYKPRIGYKPRTGFPSLFLIDARSETIPHVRFVPGVNRVNQTAAAQLPD